LVEGGKTMQSNPQILADLRVVQEAGRPIEVLTTYKGVPFIFQAIIEEISDHSVLVTSHDYCMVGLIQDNKPRVLGSDYFEPSVAKVISMDLLSGRIELGNFTYAGTKLGERMLVRVEPKAPIPLRIQSETQESQGNIVDISLSGIGVRIASTDYKSTFKPGTVVRTQFQLSSEAIDLAGTVLSAYKLNDAYRLSIRFSQDGPKKTTVFRYLIDRRAEITRELAAEYQASKNALEARDS
jgi:hypothetical protein